MLWTVTLCITDSMDFVTAPCESGDVLCFIIEGTRGWKLQQKLVCFLQTLILRSTLIYWQGFRPLINFYPITSMMLVLGSRGKLFRLYTIISPLSAVPVSSHSSRHEMFSLTAIFAPLSVKTPADFSTRAFLNCEGRRVCECRECVCVFVLQKIMTAVIGSLKATLEGILCKHGQLA